MGIEPPLAVLTVPARSPREFWMLRVVQEADS